MVLGTAELAAWNMHLEISPRNWRPETRVIAATSLLLVATTGAFPLVPKSVEVVTPVLCILGLTLAGAILRRLEFAWSTTVVVLAALVLYGVYFSYTGPNERNFDTQHQVRYIRYLLAHRAAPPEDACFVCHHPPVYYIAAASAYDLGGRLGLPNPLKAVQLLSLVFQFVFVIFGVLTVRRYVRETWATTLAAALLALWPYGVIMSARVHNDALAIPVMAAAMYGMVRWWQDEELPALAAAAGCVLLGVLVKSNSLVLVAPFVVLIAVKFFRAERRLVWARRVLPVLLAFGGALGLHLVAKGRLFVPEPDPVSDVSTETEVSDDRSTSDSVVARVLGSAYEISERSFVGNDPVNYVYFDVEAFLREPYISARKKGGEREYFLNHFLKSSLFSTHNHRPDAETSYRFNARIAAVMNVLLLGMLGLTAGVAVRARHEHVERYLPMVLAAVALGLGVAGFRWVVPHAHHCDFRHGFPLLVPGVLALVLAVRHDRRSRSVFGPVAYGVIACFLASSVIYFIPKQPLATRVFGPHTLHVPHTTLAKKVQAGAKWDDDRHVTLERGDRLQVTIPKQQVDRLEVAVDHNDRYRVTLHGTSGAQTFVIHPTPKRGMALHTRTFDPPVEGVERIVIEPLSGDWMYSVGHVIPRARKPAAKRPAAVRP